MPLHDGDALFHSYCGPLYCGLWTLLRYILRSPSDTSSLLRHEVRTTRGHRNMAQAELRRSRYPWACTDGRRTYTPANRHDYRLFKAIRSDRLVKEKLVG